MKSEKFRIHNSAFRIAFLLACVFCLPASSYAATHVTASFDLGQNPRVMATINGTPMYGLVFAQRNRPVTYNGVEYRAALIKGYLNASGQLNDGEGNAWLDLIPNLTATPAGTYYVVTLNIQGRVHSEIWVVPDQPTVNAQLCRQAEPPSATVPALFYQFLQRDGADLAQRPKLNLTGPGVNCADNSGQLRTDCTFSGGESVPRASATASGSVKTDSTAADPVVYLQSSTDSLLAGKASSIHTHPESDVTNLIADLYGKAPVVHTHAGSEVTNLVSDLAAKVPATRTISTSAPLTGGGPLSSDLLLSMPHASGGQSGYLSSVDWTAFNGKENVLTFTSPLSRPVNTISCPNCVTNVPGSAPISSSGGTTPSISIATATASAIGAGNVAGTANEISVSYAGGTGTLSIAPTFDLSGKTATAPVKATTIAGAPTSCLANKELLIQTDASPAGQQLFLCNATGNGWNKVGDGGGGGGGGDNISVNGAAAADANFSDSTPAPPANALNIKWQKASSTPNNLSAYVPYSSPLNVSSGNLTVGANTLTATHLDETEAFDFTGTLGLPRKSDPSSPVVGEVWINGAELKFRDNQGVPATQVVERQANKSPANGYASLDASSLVPNNQLPSLSGTGGCTNQFVRTLNDKAAPACATVTSGDADSTLEKTANKNGANGYAGLDASSKLTAAQGQEVWALTDLSDVAITSPALAQVIRYNGTSWVNASLACADITNCPSLVASGTAGTGPSKVGTASTAARSDHDHRSIHDDGSGVTEGSGRNRTLDYDGATSGSDGDTYLSFTETLSFSADSNNAPAQPFTSEFFSPSFFAKAIFAWPGDPGTPRRLAEAWNIGGNNVE